MPDLALLSGVPTNVSMFVGRCEGRTKAFHISGAAPHSTATAGYPGFGPSDLGEHKPKPISIRVAEYFLNLFTTEIGAVPLHVLICAKVALNTHLNRT